MFDLDKLTSVKISLASPEQIHSWAHGEVTKSETINYRTQRPEPDGLFCEKIFGPVKDYECRCGKYKKISDAGKICDKCGVEVTLKSVRRERMGYIDLAFPCTHIWFVKGAPSKMGLVLGIPPKSLEEVVYFVSHIVINPGISKILTYRQVLDENSAREVFSAVIQKEILDANRIDPSNERDLKKADEYLKKIGKNSQPLDFYTVGKFISKYLGCEFDIGGEAVLKLLKELDLDKEIQEVTEILKEKNTTEKNAKRQKAIKRLDVLESFKKSGVKPEWMVLKTIPVIPPELRPMMQLDGGRYASSDLIDLYRQVIIKNNRLKREIEEHAPNVILINEKRVLQEAVDALIDNDRKNKPVTSNAGINLKSLSSSLKGKQGRFRQNLLGKRVDYSGRSVIAVGPELNMDECGLPREMAVQLFRPFIAQRLISDPDANVISQKQADERIAMGDSRVYDAIEEICKDHPVLLNRAPTLHRLGIQAFRPILIEGKAVRLHPLVCPGFNADFDGDQMGVYVPLSRQAQAEAMTLMLANHNILKPSDGKPICVPSQDMIFGNYYLTLEDNSSLNEIYSKYYEKRNDPDMAQKYRSFNQYEGKVFSDPDTAILAYQNGLISLRTRIFVPGASLKKKEFSEKQNKSYLLTTVGKLIFNSIFPDDFPYINFPVKGSPSAKDDYKSNFAHTLDEFFVTSREIMTYLEKNNIKVDNNINIFKEYCKLQPLRAPIDKKGIQTMMDYIFRKYGAIKTAQIMDAFKNQGFDYCTKSGLTVSLDDIEPLKGRDELYEKGYKEVEKIEEIYNLGFSTDEERHEEIIKTWERINNKEMKEMLKVRMKNSARNPMFMMMESGARGSESNYMQLIGMKGNIQDSQGRTIEIPITHCFAEGLSVFEYFTATHGTRKTGSDTALKTADSGYLTRRLVDVSHNVIVREENCNCDHGIVVSDLKDGDEVIATLEERIVGRYTMHDVVKKESNGEIVILAKADTFIDEEIASKIVEAGIKEVEIRSVLTCTCTNGVCVHCYGRNLATGDLAKIGDTVGIMAAQSIGEPGTQLTLKNFHTGGVAGQTDITTGLPRVQELLEIRNPKIKDLALISSISGKVIDVHEEGLRHVFVVKNDIEEQKYISPTNSVPNVVKGEIVKAGQPLTKGHINPQELLECTNLKEVRNYIIKEVKSVYHSNGIAIADKHLEVIVRQMTDRVQVINPGSTDMLPGRRYSFVEFTLRNKEAFKSGGIPASGRPIILGIAKAALASDSFLSAASFQETTRVLTDAAIKGKTDHLKGLKENVMIGKLIPAGTGLNPILSEDSDIDPNSTDTYIEA